MGSTGPTVKCVLLRASSVKSDDDEKASSATATADVIVDRTRNVSNMSIKDMKRELTSYDINTSSFVEKSELVNALSEARLAANDNLNLKQPPSDTKIVTQDDDDDDAATKPVLHQNLIEEIPVDTTPRKSMVSKILGGDFTFLGQYEDEGIMIMIRRPVWESAASEMEEKDVPPINPHDLQPPFQNVEVRGDILLMRVAETEEELDYDEAVEAADEANATATNDATATTTTIEKEDEKPAAKSSPEIHVPTNDEFFLDYTKEEYLKFAARTDIVAPEIESSSDEEAEEQSDDEDDAKPSAIAKLLNNDEEEEDDSDDEDFDPDQDSQDFDSEEHQVGMMNMILSHMLRKFREENGRGPDSLELLEMRKALADRLGVEVPPVNEEACDWDKKVETPGKIKKRGRKKVVVAEEMNETEEIPNREDGDDFDEVDGGDVTSLKRPAQEDDDDDDEEDEDEQQVNNKKQRLNDEKEGGEES